EIPLAGDIQVEDAVLREQRQHVVEKRNAGLDAAGTVAVEVERNRDARFLRRAGNRGAAFAHDALLIEWARPPPSLAIALAPGRARTGNARSPRECRRSRAGNAAA